MRKFRHKITGITGELLEDGHLHFIRSDGKYSCQETLWKGFVENSNDWEEIKEPLFITEDGVEIFEGDIYWLATLNGVFGELPLISHKNIDLKAFKKEVKYFSTKESAEKYIEQNKPRFSVKDIENALHVKCLYSSFPIEKYISNNDFLKKLGI